MDRAFVQTRKQRHPLPQGGLEIKLALHRAFRDCGDLRLQAGVIGQLVDAFLPYHG